MRDRLIELLRGAFNYTKDVCIEFDEAVEINADYLLVNGVIVPPCKVGDTVYIVENPFTFSPLKKPQEGTVISIYQRGYGLFIGVMFDTKKINGCADYNLDWRLGKTVFLTRKEAERALKGGEEE